MANLCYYELHAKGAKKAIHILAESLPHTDAVELQYFTDDPDNSVLWAQSVCKWSLDAYTNEQPDWSFDLDALSEDCIQDLAFMEKFESVPLLQKSKLLKLKIQVHAWSDDSEFDSYEYYDCGSFLGTKPGAPDISGSEAPGDVYWCKPSASKRWESYCKLLVKKFPWENQMLLSPPIWYKDDFPNYKDFCKTFGVLSKNLKEEDWKCIGGNAYSFAPSTADDMDPNFDF